MPGPSILADVDVIIAQEMTRARQQQAVNKSQSENKLCLDAAHSFHRLPHELLLHIFRETVPPLYQHDPSMNTGPRNEWLTALRTRKALVLTCKAFFGPATEVLYEDIVFRRMGQIPALARTLGPVPPESGRDMAPLIRRIRMDGCVVWAPCADVVREDLRLILQRCTTLRAFSFHPHPQFSFADTPIDDESRDGFNPSWLLQSDPESDSVGGSLRERLSSSIRELDLAVVLDERLLVRLQWFLSAATQLTILKLGRTLQQEYTSDLLDLPVVHLAVLEELQLHTSHTSFQNYICTRWELPSLRLLTAVGCEELPEGLLQAHGSHLTYFHMSHGMQFLWAKSQLTSLSRLNTLCPVLEHLVIPMWIRDPPLINSPTLRFVDVWVDHPPPDIFREGWYQICKTSAFPSLCRIRVLGKMPRDSPQSLDWPLICHPTSIASGEQRLFVFPGGRVVQNEWGILHNSQDVDLSWERRDNSGEYVDDDVEDRTSVVSDSEEDSETSYLIDDDLEELFDGHVGPIEQYDRRTVLRMFHDSQGRGFLLEDD